MLEPAPAPWADEPAVTPVAAHLLWQAAQAADPDSFLAAALPLMLSATAADYAAIASSPHGEWVVLAETGLAAPLPSAALGEALDREACVSSESWFAAPLEEKAASGELLALQFAHPAPHGERPVAALAAVLGQALAEVRQRQRQQRRVERLESILDIASRWNRNQHTESLLVEMAEAATRLLEADRASIFLWDRHSHTLVGRPALGVGKEESCAFRTMRGIVGQRHPDRRAAPHRRGGRPRPDQPRDRPAVALPHPDACCAFRCAAAAASCSASSR